MASGPGLKQTNHRTSYQKKAEKQLERTGMAARGLNGQQRADGGSRGVKHLQPLQSLLLTAVVARYEAVGDPLGLIRIHQGSLVLEEP